VGCSLLCTEFFRYKCAAVYCSVSQRVVVSCSELQCALYGHLSVRVCCSVLQCVSCLCCGVLQRDVVCVLQ